MCQVVESVPEHQYSSQYITIQFKHTRSDYFSPNKYQSATGSIYSLSLFFQLLEFKIIFQSNRTMNFMDASQMDYKVEVAIVLILVLMYCCGLNYALYETHLNYLIEQAYASSKQLNQHIRVVIYCFLISANILIGCLIAFLSDCNTLGVTSCLESDIFNLLIICGYITYIDQSRHSPINGYLFFRDAIFYLLLLSITAYTFGLDTITAANGIVLACIYGVYGLSIYMNKSLQFSILYGVGIIKEENGISIDLLETQSNSKMDINEIQDIIIDNQESVDLEIRKFNTLLKKVVEDEKQRKIRENFAMMVMSFKKAIEIKKKMEKEQRSEIYQRFWVTKQKLKYQVLENQQQNSLGSPKIEQFSDVDQIIIKRTTIDSQAYESPSKIAKVMSFLYYPLYETMYLTLRLKYLCVLISLIILFLNVWFMNFACRYIGKGIGNSQIWNLMVTSTWSLPLMSYFVKLSKHANYDYYNLFFQCGILKLGGYVAIGLILNSIVNSKVSMDIGNYYSYFIVVQILVLSIAIVMIAVNRLEVKQSMFKFEVTLYTCAFIASFVLLTL